MPIKHYTSLSLVVFVMISAFPQGSSAADLCAGADYKALCRSVVGRVKTPYAAAEATVKRLISETKKANLSAVRLPKKDYSQTCATLYNDAISDLETSLKDLRSRDLGSFNVRLSAVRSNGETCKDAFAEMGKQFPLAAQNTLIQQLASTGSNAASQWGREGAIIIPGQRARAKAITSSPSAISNLNRVV